MDPRKGLELILQEMDSFDDLVRCDRSVKLEKFLGFVKGICTVAGVCSPRSDGYRVDDWIDHHGLTWLGEDGPPVASRKRTDSAMERVRNAYENAYLTGSTHAD